MPIKKKEREENLEKTARIYAPKSDKIPRYDCKNMPCKNEKARYKKKSENGREYRI